MPAIVPDPIEIVNDEQVLAYLGLDEHPSIDLIVELTNGLVTEKWANPTAEVPVWVLAIALEVAARPLRNPKGLASWTLSHDETSRTERLPETRSRAGVFLTSEELRQLLGTTARRQRYGTIRTRPGY